MTRIALTTALALSLAAPAFANDQLAASLGVDAGDYSVAELIQLRSALENDDHSHVAFLLNGGSETISTQSFAAPAFANAQLAASLGVDAGDYTLAELIQLRSALENDDHSHVAFLLNGGDEQVSTQSFGEPEHVAIARALVGFTDSENE
ncbi:hypothetical protein [Boseongicola sp. H5]|uniref:hypothetical protein n=1 Tax=Boseongicola sp. H5 TaxID=2763261 RepID=UPI001D0BC7D6|nr:hypothetical protein [Boseongicola sp. H5]